jgi:hypothetical protein
MSQSFADKQAKPLVSAHECRAMRQLDRDDEYTRSEIAFMFETKVETVARHADRECPHVTDARTDPQKEYTETDLVTAYRAVCEDQPYQQMSQQVYDEHRPDDYPSASTIRERFGSWPAARAHVQEVTGRD